MHLSFTNGTLASLISSFTNETDVSHAGALHLRYPLGQPIALVHCYLERHSVWNGERKHKTQPRLTQERLGTRYIMHKIYICIQN